MKRSKPDPVGAGYRVAGVVFTLIAIGILLVCWYIRDAGWLILSFTMLMGLGLLFPALGMLFAKTNDDAKRASAWLLLDLIFPH